MHKIKFKAFNLIEVMIVVGIVSIILAIVGPSFTKRIRNRENSNCVGGIRTVRKVFMAKYDGANIQNFSAPDNVKGDFTVTLIGGGGAGYEGSSTAGNPPANCNLSSASGYSFFYQNVNFHAVSAGESASCTSSSGNAGNSGTYFYAYDIPVKKSEGLSFSYNGAQSTWSGSLTNGGNSSSVNIMSKGFIQGETGSNGSPNFLQGGVPQVMIKNGGSINLGIGESCAWSYADNQYKPAGGSGATGSGCYLTFNQATPGRGGGSGGFAKFSISPQNAANCTITVGKGGISGQNNGYGGDTTFSCGGSTYKAGGGGGASNSSFGSGGSNAGITSGVSLNGISGESYNGIAGGRGGSVYVQNLFNAKGGNGGCYGAESPGECQNPNGESGTSPISDLTQAGSGGGGGSCSEGSCGIGGRGGDGLAIIEYKTKCY